MAAQGGEDMKAREREAGDGEEKQTEKTVTTVNSQFTATSL